MFGYVLIWLSGLLFLSYEYYCLAFHKAGSFFLSLQRAHILSPQIEFSTVPGRPLSLWLGWFGLGLMILMNLYSLRKRTQWMTGWGGLKVWLNFHVFCGLLGPTFIFFHCNFKARGLVAISFWSMIVSLTSGIVGRYLYIQILGQQSELSSLRERIRKRLDELFQSLALHVPEDEKEEILARALVAVGLNRHREASSPLNIFFRSLIADLKMSLIGISVGPGWPSQSQYLVTQYALTQRKIEFWGAFQRLMGYWHTFHFPFAIFMYLAALIHVIAALVFGV